VAGAVRGLAGLGFRRLRRLLFNYVAPNCVPTLLGLTIGSPEAKAATLQWTGVLTSLLLLGWAAGGILFGRVADRIGRTRTLLLTMLLYSIGTAACAFAPNLAWLAFFRLIASLGIGGEWAAGAAMVAEVVPEHRRVEAGALLYTSSPLGLFLATFVTYQIQGVHMNAQPELAWRYVFLTGLIPAAVAFVLRLFVKEPERWARAASSAPPPRSRAVHGAAPRRHAVRARHVGGRTHHVVELQRVHAARGQRDSPPPPRPRSRSSRPRRASWERAGRRSPPIASTWAAARHAAHRSARQTRGAAADVRDLLPRGGLAVMAAFGLPMANHTRLYMYFFIGLTVFGVFGSFTYYLPELFPTRLRGTGAGFCYNAGRVIAAVGPFLVGGIASRGADALASALSVLFWVGAVPLAGLLLLPFVIETKGRALAD
jgi:MFS family permease